MAIKKRTKIPKTIETQLLFKTDYKCCVCQERGDHIHHLDENPNNNELDNLAFLCFKDHDLASLKRTLKKKLTKEAIIKYREHHYKVIDNKRMRELHEMDNPIAKLTDEKLLTISKTAIIILELENIKVRFHSENSNGKFEILYGILNKYRNHTNIRLAYEVFEFLSSIADQTRAGMTDKVASLISWIIEDFLSPIYDSQNKKQIGELSKQCIEIGYSMAYDSFIHLRKINVAVQGLSILKYIHRKAKKNKIRSLLKQIDEMYLRLEATLHRPERNDLGDAKEVVKIFHENLNTDDFGLPDFPDNIMTRLGHER